MHLLSLCVCVSKIVMQLAVQVEQYWGFWFLCKSCPHCYAYLSLAPKLYNVCTGTIGNGL